MLSSNGLRAVSKTLRFKTAAAFVGLFFTTVLVSFIAVFLTVRAWIYRDIDGEISFFLHEFGVEYMIGAEYSGPDIFVKTESLPLEVRSVVKSADPAFEPKYVFAEKGKKFWIGGVSGDKTLSFDVAYPSLKLERTEYFPKDRIANINEQFNGECYGEGFSNIFFLLFSADGGLLANSDLPDPSFGSLEKFPEILSSRRPGTVDAGDGLRFRARAERVYDGSTLVVGQSLRAADSGLDVLYAIFSTTLVFILVAGAVFGWLVSGRFVRGINRVARAVRGVQSGDFSSRVKHESEGTEIDELADAFNQMAEHTEKVLGELRTISDNIAHDLKTPLTRMRGKAEMSLYSKTGENLAAVVSEECSDMLAMINTMLEITQTASHVRHGRREDIDIAAVAAESIEIFSTVAEDKAVALEGDVPSGPIIIKGAKMQFQRLFANLLDNAIKFTDKGGTVFMSVKTAGSSVEIKVKDNGCGIPEDDLPKVFDRFQRSDKSRHIPGNGLGLSLVRAIIESYSGVISIGSEEGSGTEVFVRIPLVSE